MSCYTAVSAAAAAAVRHRVLDGNFFCCGPLYLIPVFFFSFKHDLFSRYSLAVRGIAVALQRRFFLSDTLGN